MSRMPAAVLTVGTELVTGLALDANMAEIARALHGRGARVAEVVSIGDDEDAVEEALRRLVGRYPLVVVTGGLGPTHDDVTREAAASALGRALVVDETLAARLAATAGTHREPGAAARVLRQARVIEGARVVVPSVGTAPGLEVATPAGRLFLLPGPPREMRSMLSEVLGCLPGSVASPRVLGCVGIRESDAQLAAQRALEDVPGVGLGLLSAPGDVRVVLFDDGAGEEALGAAAERVRDTIGGRCYAVDGATLAEAVLREASRTGATIALAESCTGGLVAAALTDVPGVSASFLGASVTYSDTSKRTVLGVSDDTLAAYGAVSRETAREMAEGARRVFGADVAVSVTGIAGPEGGTTDKPVGTVWFGLASGRGTRAALGQLGGDRTGVRQRATASALHILLCDLQGR